MLKAIYTYELTRLLRQPATYLYFGVFFAMALLSMLGTGGYFDAAPKPGKGLRLLNSPHEINFIFQYFNKFFLFLLPAIIGMTIYKDFKNQVYPLLYAFPIKKSDYLFGKFFSALTVVLVITLSAGIAFYLGERMLTRDNPIIGPTTLWGYASAYFFFVFPNMFLYGLLVFSVVAALRNPFAGFMAVLLLFLVQVATDNLFAGNPWPGALLEPFGQNAAAYETRYWTIAEQNVRQIPVWGIVLWNRILWAIISLVCFGLFYSKFQLEQETFRLLPNRAPKRKTAAGAFPHASSSGYHRPVARVDFSVRRQIQAMLQLSIVDFKYIIRSWLFHVMLLFGILALVFALSRVTNRGDLTFLPLTRIMLSIPMFFFSTVIMLLTFLYSGMLVHRAQMAKANQLIDATGTSNWVLLGSKILALLQVQVVLLCVLMMCGIGLQLYHGYYHLEIGLYLYHLFVLTFPTLMIWAVISLCTHTLAPNVYPVLVLLLLAWLGKEQLPEWGIESHLFRFNSPPQLVYSDLNGFGHGLLAVHLVNAYWLAFAGLAFVVAYLFWQRGNTYSFQERMEQAIQRFKGFVPPVAFLLCCLFCGLGLTIHQEENSPFQPADNQAQVLEQFRANFGAYAPVAQPKITSVKLTIDLFPETRSFTAAGAYWLVNRTTQNIDTLWIKTGYDEITAYALDAPSRLLREDKEMQVAVHVLETPLQPADSLRMRFDIKNKPTTLFYQNAAVLENGTFLRTDILPRLGYSFGQEAREPADRLSRYLNFYSQDADLVDIETTIRTNRLQTAIAPGHLQKQWKKNGSAYFHYRTKEKIKFAFAFNSGVYAIHKTQYRGVALEIYHHHKHDENIRDMQEGLKAALDYNTHYFGPY
ncbi:MAG: ABC transporter permease, partial [Haliscomenobacter sp.]|nr:ABC transporter permease [Haliscomenobacter sp.]